MEITVPEVGESVFEALVARWYRKDGDRVEKGESLCEIETDKITLEISAEAAGTLRIAVGEGTTVRIGSVIGAIEESGEGTAEPAGAPGGEGGPAPDVGRAPEGEPRHVSPSERKAARGKADALGQGPEPGVTADSVPRAAGGPRPEETACPAEAPSHVRSEEPPTYHAAPAATGASGERRETRKPLTPIRKRIAARLLEARQQTAMLTTFNEADMGEVLSLRARHDADFRSRHGVKLGFMPFFIKACVEALREYPAVNARIDGDDIVYHDFYDIGIAVSGAKGLVVPVLRNAERLHFAEIEQIIAGFVEKLATNRLAISDLEGGTFTISNGGVFGSLLSTPILNPPQSGVLGMHAVQERPVARNGQVVVRPMMYLALSYDHRIIDGREAVLFLKRVREYVENPGELVPEW